MKFTFLGIIPLPQALHRRDQLTHALAGFPGIHARHHAFVFKGIGPAGNPQIQAAIGDDIGQRRLACQADGVPEGRNHRARAQTDVFSMAGHIHEVQEGIWRDGEIHPMMLTGPDRMHATAIGDFAQFYELVIELLLVLVGRNTLHMRKQGKLHVTQLPDTILRTSPLIWLP